MRYGKLPRYYFTVVVIGGLHLGFMGETMTGMLVGKIRGIFFPTQSDLLWIPGP